MRLCFDLKISRDGETNIPCNNVFQQLIFSLLKTHVLFPTWLYLASVSGHWFSLFLGQINLFIIIPTDIQPWHTYPVFPQLPEIWMKDIMIWKGKSPARKDAATPFFFFLRQLISERHAVFWGCSLSSNFSPLAPCRRAPSAESPHTAAGGKNTFPTFSGLEIPFHFLVCHISGRDIQCQSPPVLCWTATLCWGRKHASSLTRNSGKLKDLSICVQISHKQQAAAVVFAAYG